MTVVELEECGGCGRYCDREAMTLPPRLCPTCNRLDVAGPRRTLGEAHDALQERLGVDGYLPIPTLEQALAVVAERRRHAAEDRYRFGRARRL